MKEVLSRDRMLAINDFWCRDDVVVLLVAVIAPNRQVYGNRNEHWVQTGTVRGVRLVGETWLTDSCAHLRVVLQ